MKKYTPATPFSTRLSGSAKETELRIQNIIQGPKKRPPVLVMALMVLAILSCGNLVSCQSHTVGEPDAPDTSSAAPSAPESEDVPSSHPLEEMSQWWNGSYYTRVYNTLLSSSYSGYTAISTPIEVLLDGLTVQSLPTRMTDINNPHLSRSWNDCVWLLAEDQQADVSLYGVAVSEGTPQNSQSFQTGGIILRHGSNWVYCPEFWDCWYGSVPSLSVRDWDGDGASEAAVIFPQGMGVGIWTSGLAIFELDDLSYTRPDYNQFTDTIVVNYDEEAGNLLVSLGDTACTIPVQDVLWDSRSWGGEDGINLIELGSLHEYYFFNGRGITAWLGLDISGWTRGWLCADLTFDGENYIFDNILLLEGEDISNLAYHTYCLQVPGRGDLSVTLDGRPASQDLFQVDQIRVYEGNTPLQTMDVSALAYNGPYLYEGLFANVGDSTYAAPDIRDINFDGADDLGLLCGFSYNGPRRWFLWDEEAGQFQPSIFTSLDLTVDQESHQLIDVWKDGNIAKESITYECDDQGTLVQIGSNRVEASSPDPPS